MPKIEMSQKEIEEHVTRKASLLTNYFWTQAYFTRDDSTAIELTKAATRPILSYLHAGGEKPDFMEINRYLNKFWQDKEIRREINGDREKYKFNIGYRESELTEFYEELERTFEPQDFDLIVGVYSSGIPEAILASEYFDCGYNVLRYSHLQRNDKEVMTTEVMDKSLDPEGSRIFLADDCISSGETLKKVGAELLEGGASEIISLPVNDKRNIDEPLYLETILRVKEKPEDSNIEDIDEQEIEHRDPGRTSLKEKELVGYVKEEGS